jgi:hypothetical protein
MSWTTALNALGVNRFCTRIEIKPHTRDGIYAGIEQLLSPKWAKRPNPNCSPGRTMKHFLVTYQELSPPSDQFLIQIASITPAALAVVTRRGWKDSSLGFRPLGTITVGAVNQMIRLGSCATLRGNELEKSIRAHYVTAMNQRFATPLVLSTKHGSATGPDIDHEFAEFLAELAAQLQPSVG